MPKLGIALSGGGVKGAAHIGVLKALEEENIKIDCISGTSSGSIVASLYACGYSPNEILMLFNRYLSTIIDYNKNITLNLGAMLVTGRLNIKGLAKGSRLENILYKHFLSENVTNISNLNMPLAVPAVGLKEGNVNYYLSRKIDDNDINTDEKVNFFYNGQLSKIVRASSSFPGVFEPVVMDGRLLVDGGVLVNTPVSILKGMNADITLAVCFESSNNFTRLNLISNMVRSFDIMAKELNKREIRKADIVITPKLGKVSMLNFKDINLIANAGYLATKEKISKIRDLINENNMKSLVE